MEYGNMLLSKIIDDNDVAALRKHNVRESDLQTNGERETYRFIVEYAEQNKGGAPDYRTAVAECSQFTYMPAVEDSYEYLTKQIKSYAAKVQYAELIEKEVPKIFEENDGFRTIDETIEKLLAIKQSTEIRSKLGVDLKADIDVFLQEYENRKAGNSFKLWKSSFPTVNKTIGGYYSGNLYTWFGRSGRGKSTVVMYEIIEAAMQGANILIYVLEMSEYEWLARAYSALSARLGLVTSKINGTEYDGGFATRDLISGRMAEPLEAGLFPFLMQINEMVPGNITIRAADTEGFYDRSVKQIEADILQTKADVVVIDPIYLLDFEANTSKTAGGDVANTSKKLRRIAGYTKTVMHIITQADEVREERDSDGERQIRVPERSEVRKTKQVLEDAFNLFAIDTCDGRGVVAIAKGRQGGEGVQTEILYLPEIGIVREMVDVVDVNQFDF